MTKMVLYRAENYWYWYLLHPTTKWHPLVTPDGREHSLRKALVAGREYAKRNNREITYIEMEKDED